MNERGSADGAIRIGVDLAGSDASQQRLFAACVKAAAEIPVCIRCYHSAPLFVSDSSLDTVLCPDVISMEDEALLSIRKKKESSLVRAICDVKNGHIDALVTCANTGAVTAASVVYLKRFKGLHHPALVAVLPLPRGPVVALDMGAFVEASKGDLVSYASLGAAYATMVCGIDCPRVGLLNIGREASRGTIELQEAHKLLSVCSPKECHYLGNIEPLDVFSGKVDVLVTSGFAGNIFLKTAEAVVLCTSAQTYQGSGALLAGVHGVVVKCHGEGSSEALMAAINQAKQFVERKTISNIASRFSD